MIKNIAERFAACAVFALAASAYSFVALALFYWIVDVKGWRHHGVAPQGGGDAAHRRLPSGERRRPHQRQRTDAQRRKRSERHHRPLQGRRRPAREAQGRRRTDARTERGGRRVVIGRRQFAGRRPLRQEVIFVRSEMLSCNRRRLSKRSKVSPCNRRGLSNSSINPNFRDFRLKAT